MKHAEKLETLPIADLVPYARNARTHSDQQVAQIAKSIREFGFTNPVLIDGDGGIVAGHGRVMAAQSLGMDVVPCLRVGWLTEAQKRAYILADNQLALQAGWDEAMLAEEMQWLEDDGFDIATIGFSDEEMERLLSGTNFKPGTVSEQGRLDEKAPTVCPNCKHAFVL